MISPELVEQIRQKADIVQVISSYINVIKKGNSYVAVCPFHADKNPSLQISSSKQIYKCFACGAGGNVFNFVENYEHISYFDAVRKVADLIGFKDDNLEKPVRKVDEKTQNALNALKAATELYKYLLKTQDGQICADYLAKRNISQEMQEYFDLGYSSGKSPDLSIKLLRNKGIDIQSLDDAGLISRSNGQFVDRFAGRLIFPIYNEYSEVIGYSARRIVDNDDAKYVNSQNTILFNKSKVLYNYQNAKNEAKKEGYVYVTEGFMDVFALYTAGIKSAVALMGTAFTQHHAKMLRRLNVDIRLCLDGDDAGQHGMLAASEILDAEGLSYHIVNYKDCKLDPDEILQQFGKEKLKDVVTNVFDRNEFVFNYYLKRCNLDTLEGKKEFASKLIPYVSKIQNPIDREVIIKNISYKTGISTQTYTSLLSSADSFSKIDFNEAMNERPNSSVSLINIRRINRVQNAIMYQVLCDNHAIDDMENSKNYFLDKVYGRILNYVIDLYQSSNQFNASELISFLSQNNDELSKKMINIITNIMASEDNPPYSQTLMKEYLEILDAEILKKQRDDYIQNTLKGKSPEEAAVAVQKYFDSMKGVD